MFWTIPEKIVRNQKDEQVIGVIDPSLVAAGEVTFTQTLFDVTTRADACKIRLTNGTATANANVYNVGVRGKLVRRLSGDKGFKNDKHVNLESILKDGESDVKIQNNMLCTAALVNQLADFMWKEHGSKKHLYELSFFGERVYFEPGEWYELTIGGAGQAENISVYARCVSVQVQRSAGGAQTVVIFREVQQNWTFDSNAVARSLASGDTSKFQNVLTVASSTYIGPADFYCDGTNDEVEIQAAIDYLSGASSGGLIKLTEGTFAIEAAIEMASGIILSGTGPGTILEKNCNDYAIEAVGAGGSELTGVELRSFVVTRDAGDTNSIDTIHFAYSDRCKLYDITVDTPYLTGVALTYCDDAAVHNCRVLSSRKHGIYADNCNVLTITGCTIDYESAGPSVTSAYGIAVDTCTSATVSGCKAINMLCGASIYGTGFGGLSDHAVFSGNVAAECYGFGVRGYEMTSAAMLVTGNHAYNIIGETGIGYIITGDRSKVIGNTATNCSGYPSTASASTYDNGNGIRISTSIPASTGIQIVSNYLTDCGSLIRCGDCESAEGAGPYLAPSFATETGTAVTKSNCTWARSDEQAHWGTYSYKFIKTVAAGTAAYLSLGDNETTTDMHVARAGEQYTLSVWVYIPTASGIQASEVTVNMDEYVSGAWSANSTAATTLDAWEEVTVNATLAAATTGFRVRITAASAAENNEYFYTDSLRLKQHGIRNDYTVQFADNGTGTLIA